MMEKQMMETSNFSLPDAILQGAHLAEQLGIEEAAQGLRAALDRLNTDTIRVLVIGEYGRGKTSFLNALLGEKILSVSPLPTPTINIIRWAEVPSASAGERLHANPVPVHSLGEEEYKYVELMYPLSFLRDPVEFVEMPDVSDTSLEPTTAEMIQGSDLVVVVLACDTLYSASEARMVERIEAAGHRDLFFICNFIDRIPEDEQDKLINSAYTRIPVRSDHIFFTSPTKALAGHPDAQSAIKEVLTAIHKTMTSRTTTIKSERAITLLQGLLTTVHEQLGERKMARENAAAVADKQARAIHEAYEEVMASSRQIMADLDNFQARTRDVVEQMVSSFIRELSFKVENWIINFEGEDQATYLENQIKGEVGTWRHNILANYLQENVGRQKESLVNRIDHYRENLKALADLVPPVRDDFEFNVILDVPEVHDFNVKARTKHPNGNGSQPLQVSWTQMPDVLLLASGSIAAIVLVQPRFVGIPVGLAGLAVAVVIASSRRSRTTGPLDRASLGSAYASDIRMQADAIGQSVWRSVNKQFEEARRQIEKSLQTQTNQVRQSVQKELDQLRTRTVSENAIESQLKALGDFLAN